LNSLAGEWRLWAQQHVCCVGCADLSVHGTVRLQQKRSGSKEREDNCSQEQVSHQHSCAFAPFRHKQAPRRMISSQTNDQGQSLNNIMLLLYLCREPKYNCPNIITAHTRPVSFSLNPPFSSVFHPSILSYASPQPSKSRKRSSPLQ
jgi:hypothetical protein